MTVPVSGFRIILRASGRNYDYRVGLRNPNDVNYAKLCERGEIPPALLEPARGARTRTYVRGDAFVVTSDDRTRAFVVTADAPIAAVDLRTMRVTYHRPSPPVAETPIRDVRWVDGGAIAVLGWSDAARWLRLLDTRTWRVRVLRARPAYIDGDAGRILAWGPVYGVEASKGQGIAGWDARGRLRFRVFRGSDIGPLVTVVGGRAYVRLRVPDGVVHPIDLRRGRLLETRRLDPLLRLLRETPEPNR